MEALLPVESEQLEDLRSAIAMAEQTLATLQAAIWHARSDGGMLQLQQVLAENERLMAQSWSNTAEMDSAHAALDAAIRASETDPLTGLPNRLVLWSRLAHDIAVARRCSNFLAVYFLDLDGFKTVNDEFGHAAGDRLLQIVATRLSQTMRASDTVCRVGGDEFIVIVHEANPSDVAEVGRKILAALDAPFLFEGHVHSPCASIGCSSYPLDGETPEVLVQQADAAMYRAKRQKKCGTAITVT